MRHPSESRHVTPPHAAEPNVPVLPSLTREAASTGQERSSTASATPSAAQGTSVGAPLCRWSGPSRHCASRPVEHGMSASARRWGWLALPCVTSCRPDRDRACDARRRTWLPRAPRHGMGAPIPRVAARKVPNPGQLRVRVPEPGPTAPHGSRPVSGSLSVVTCRSWRRRTLRWHPLRPSLRAGHLVAASAGPASAARSARQPCSLRLLPSPRPRLDLAPSRVSPREVRFRSMM